ncbi:MAG: hypothetical protein LUG96_08440, partial [Tannerellaceae bacterium]|nr:hypothetical protein [Tannerellaceae bacterium]
ITAMTNFGNGYPERNQPTGGFSYLYDKCDIHDNPEAIRAQQQYIASLISHRNPYTGHTYMDDPDIVGFEINNEPCHAGTQEQTLSYITKMVEAIRNTGNKKPIFYNVSHNMQQLEAYYAAPIQGTTYQWYPIGLVAGHTRYGNFLPFVENYHIPFSNLKGFSDKTKLVYEFDPADIIYSYMYPATTRAFRSAGFQWITQFAYDPIDMAWANTEYQTHFLNLAYTPRKAISMKIAAEVAHTIPQYASFDPYPADTLFGHFRVSYKEDLSEMNTPERFYYSNHTLTQPIDVTSLHSITGYGNSPVIRYEGTGAYFLDRLENGVWRLEVMPDAIKIRDPFEKPSLQREVVTILHHAWNMDIHLPDLGEGFSVTGINDNNNRRSNSTGGTIPALEPGVYLLQKNGVTPVTNWQKDTHWQQIRLGEYVAPAFHTHTFWVSHQAPVTVESDRPLTLTATIAGPGQPDSVLIYTDRVSFWNPESRYIKMKRTTGYTYEGTFPGEEIQPGNLRYHIVVCHNGQQYTFPEGVAAGPLAWDFSSAGYYTSRAVRPESPVTLYTASQEDIESYIIPESWGIRKEIRQETPARIPMACFTFRSKEETPRFFLRRYIAADIEHRKEQLENAQQICMYAKDIPAGLQIGFVTSDGYTYTAMATTTGEDIIRIPLRALQQTSTALLPHAYPTFLEKYFTPVILLPFRTGEIEYLEISFTGEQDTDYNLEIGAVWLE